MKLYEINAEIEKVIEAGVDKETGELDPAVEKELDRLQQEKEQKIVSIGHYIKNVLALVSAIREEEKKLAERRKQVERRLEWLKEYLKNNLDGQTILTPTLIISYRKSERVEVEDVNIEQLEKTYPELIRVKKEIDKTAAKKKLKDGIGIQGLKLVQTTNIQVK